MLDNETHYLGILYNEYQQICLSPLSLPALFYRSAVKIRSLISDVNPDTVNTSSREQPMKRLLTLSSRSLLARAQKMRETALLPERQG